MQLNCSTLTTPIMPPAPPIRALLLDDSKFDRDRIRRLSRKTDLALDLDEVSCLADMEQAVEKENYDLILIDYRLPEGDGLSALSKIQNTARNKTAGTIMITGDGNVDTAVAALKNGCHDYLTKDGMTVDLLRSAMLNAMERSIQARNILSEAAQHAQIRETIAHALSDVSMQDTLVGILQRHLRNAGVAAAGPQSGFGTANSPILGLPGPDAQDLSLMVEMLMQDDEFIFH
ncbi:response regulator [Sulfitobacter sabulilitoris]|uniref:Response regulator n=1 Tax=Sulfitobacter sabulilitoris TaxID=2562655 RepID=A0A5S3PSA5_9RHOB|nr:response regulator [Sulfitobacter sabulilitoris]TMM55455.1 response regulator [Sulfitobacter sabulilitoris]